MSTNVKDVAISGLTGETVKISVFYSKKIIFCSEFVGLVIAVLFATG